MQLCYSMPVAYERFGHHLDGVLQQQTTPSIAERGAVDLSPTARGAAQRVIQP
jgi:hypothetical protein